MVQCVRKISNKNLWNMNNQNTLCDSKKSLYLSHFNSKSYRIASRFLTPFSVILFIFNFNFSVWKKKKEKDKMLQYVLHRNRSSEGMS